MKRLGFPLLLTLVALAIAFSPALAQDTSHVYGVVFHDNNLNGVWDVGEPPAPDVTVNIESAGGEDLIALTSAGTEDELDPEEDNVCDLLDPDAPTPCAGTWGMIPAGEPGSWWQVWVEPPAGYFVTSENPQWVQSQGQEETAIVQFGLAPVGAGGPGDGEVLPVTGAGLELYAAGMLLVTGISLTLKSRFRK